MAHFTILYIRAIMEYNKDYLNTDYNSDITLSDN